MSAKRRGGKRASSAFAAWQRLRTRTSQASAERYPDLRRTPHERLNLLVVPRPTALLAVRSQALFDFLAPWAARRRWMLCVPPHVPSIAVCALIRAEAQRLQVPMMFIGDLDPIALTLYASLRSGDGDAPDAAKHVLPLHYLGINDRWLDVCDKEARGALLNGFTLRMGPLERRHYQVVKKLIPHLDALVGRRCFDLLESGSKLEVAAAATVSSGFRKRFPSFIASLMRDLPGPSSNGGSTSGQPPTRERD